MRACGCGFERAVNFWVGLSYFLPGGGAEMSESSLERVTWSWKGGRRHRRRRDDAREDGLCLLAEGDAAIVNRTNLPASMLVIMPYPEGTGR